MKKLRIMILLIILSFSFFLLLYSKKRSYELTYKKGKYIVTEKYIKKDKIYYVSVKDGKNDYFYIIDQKYTKKRKLVDIVKKESDDSTTCFVIKFNKKLVTPSCKNNDSYISHNTISEELKSKLSSKLYSKYKNKYNKTYKNMTINTLYGKKILVWNYHGFYILEKGNLDEIKLFSNDTYNVSLIGQIDNYLLIPNYKQSYEYKDLIILDTDSLKTKELKLNENMSEDSYVMGINDKSIFYYDMKYHREYEIVPYKNRYRLVNNYIYEKGVKKDKTEINLSNNIVNFTYDTTYSYKLIGEDLYRYNKYNNYKEKVTNLKVKEIVKADNNDVYFISEEALYVHNDKYGDIKLIDYFELNFNYKNIFYIFD